MQEKRRSGFNSKRAPAVQKSAFKHEKLPQIPLKDFGYKEQILEEQIASEENNDIGKKIQKHQIQRITLASKDVDFQINKDEQSRVIDFEKNQNKNQQLKTNFSWFINNTQFLQTISTKLSSQISTQLSKQHQRFTNQQQDYENIDSANNLNSLSSNQIRNMTFQSFFQQIQTPKRNQPQLAIKRGGFISYKRQNIKSEYHILQKIGQGAFGNVFKCQHKTTKAIRSVKIIKTRILDLKRNRQTLKREIQILKKLDHPSIIKLFQIFQYEKVIYLVCEYCGGGTLKWYISNRFKFSNQMKISIIRKVFEGVSYMHKMRVIHRDLKPQNILFVNKINVETSIEAIDLRIIDFGLSIQSKESEFKDWAKIGTLSYMAPQIFKGIYSPKADSWSCGVIMHILFLGYNPFSDSQHLLILEKIRNYRLEDSPKWLQLQKPIRSILSSLLNPNYVLRGQIESIVQNNCFKQLFSHQYYERQKTAGGKLRNAKKEHTLVTLLKYYLTFNMISQRKIKQFGDLFNFVDNNKNGVISLQELQQCLLNQGEMDQKVAKRIVSSIDYDKSGLISFGQFACAFANDHEMFTIQNINQIFSKIDTSKDGLIDLYEFKRFLADFNKKQLTNVEHIFESMQGEGAKEHKVTPNQFLWYIMDKVYLQSKQ